MVIDFFSNDDLRGILELVQNAKARSGTELMDKFIENQKNSEPKPEPVVVQVTVAEAVSDLEREREDKELAKAEALMKATEEAVRSVEEAEPVITPEEVAEEEKIAMNDKAPEEFRKEVEEEDDLYSIQNFSI